MTDAFPPDWPRAIFFDFDGVIVNSEPLHYQAFARVLAEESIPLTWDEYRRELIGFDDRGAIAHLLARHGRALEQSDRLMARKAQVTMNLIRARDYRALDGVDALIRGLLPHYPLGICSGALRAEIEMMLDGISLRDCFKLVVAAEDVITGKPDPQGYLLCVQRMSALLGRPLTPADCLVVEDAPQVIRTVRQEGFPTLAVTTSHPAGELSDANWVLPTLEPHQVTRALPQLKLAR